MMNQKLGEALASVDMSESGAGLQEGIQNSLTGCARRNRPFRKRTDDQYVYCNGPVID